MVAGNANHVPVGHFVSAILKNVRNQAHARIWREDIRPTRDVFFENVILDCAPQLLWLNALLLCYSNIHCQQYSRWGIDRHTSGNFIQRNSAKKCLHILKGGNRNAHLAHFAQRNRVIGIVTNLRGQVKGY